MTTPDIAAFVNGTMVRYFDFSDAYISLETGHPSDNVHACLAVAESEGPNGVLATRSSAGSRKRPTCTAAAGTM
jgi:2-methylcitrate dehydratase PrpD